MQLPTILSTLVLLTRSYGFSNDSYDLIDTLTSENNNYDLIDTLISENNYAQFPSNYSNTSVLAIQHDYIDDATNNTVQINYDLLNALVNQDASIDHDLEKRWYEHVVNTWIYIKNRYEGHPSDKNLVHHVISNTDWVSAVVSAITAYLTMSDLTSHNAYESCGSYFFDHSNNGYIYYIGVYKFTKPGHECKLSSSNYDSIRQSLTDAFNTDVYPNCTGRCFTLDTGGSTVVYIKYTRYNSDVHMEDVSCNTKNGWGTP